MFEKLNERVTIDNIYYLMELLDGYAREIYMRPACNDRWYQLVQVLSNLHRVLYNSTRGI